MSIRLGNPKSVIAAAAALDGGAARSVGLGGGGNQWAVIASIFLTYVASATVGNRFIIVQVKDAGGNILWSVTQGTAVTAGQTVTIGLGGGVPSSNQTAPFQQFMPIPDGFTVPANANVVVSDFNNIDTADTVAMNLVYSN